MDLYPDPDEFVAAFQARLRREREERDLSQNQVATALGLNLSTYKHYETRLGSKFPIHLLPKLSVLFDRPMIYWLTGQELHTRRPRNLRLVTERGK